MRIPRTTTLFVTALAASLHFPAIANAFTFYSDMSSYLTAVGPNQTTIDFDTDGNGAPLPAGVSVTNQYAAVGASFSSTVAGYPLVNALPGSLPNVGSGTYSGGNFIQMVPRTQGGGDFSIVFGHSINQFSMWVGDLETEAFGTTEFSYFNNGQLLGTQSVNQTTGPAPLAFTFFGASFGTGVDEISITLGSGDYVVFDDIGYSTVTPVPIPAGISMMSLAIAFLVGGSRIRKRQRFA